MKYSYDTQQPYIASYVIFTKQKKVALLLRSDKVDWSKHMWCLPSGKVEQGETATQCAIREAKEEAGADLQASDLTFAHCMHRNPDNNTTWVDFVFRCNNWSGELFTAEPEVHTELAWFSLDDLPDNIIPSVKAILESVATGKTFSQFGW